VSERSAEQQRLVDEIETVLFKPTHFRKGYSMVPVDELLDRAAQAISAGEPLAPLLRVELPTVTVRAGYDIEQVDDFIARLRASA
jgi:DivIVA domain-containing protein